MTPFAIAINDYVANIKTTAEAPVRQAPIKEFNAAVENFLGLNKPTEWTFGPDGARYGDEMFLPNDDFSALTGAGAEWNNVTERAALWADVAATEDDYRNTKVDGREG